MAKFGSHMAPPQWSNTMPVASHMAPPQWSNTMPVASLLITAGGGSFPQILDLLGGLKIGVPSGCPGEPGVFKVMIDDVTFIIKAEIYMVSPLNFINSMFIDGRYSRPFSAGGGSPTASTPLAIYGPVANLLRISDRPIKAAR